MDDFAILAVRRHFPECDISVPAGADEFGIILDPDPLVLPGVGFGDFKGAIGAAVIDDAILEVLIGLRQYTFNTFDQITLAVVHGRKHADQRL
jgi:hypothetical protein